LIDKYTLVVVSTGSAAYPKKAYNHISIRKYDAQCLQSHKNITYKLKLNNE
jgi:hypothetical protein